SRLSRCQVSRSHRKSKRSAVRVTKESIRPATDVLDSIIMSTTRAAGITAAAGTRLTRPLLLVLFRNENSVHKVHALGVPPSWFPTLRSFRDCCAPSGLVPCLSFHLLWT